MTTDKQDTPTKKERKDYVPRMRMDLPPVALQQDDKQLNNLKSELFNALEVFDLEQSAKTPYGTKFWLDCKKAVEKYAAAAQIQLVSELEKQGGLEQPSGNSQSVATKSLSSVPAFGLEEIAQLLIENNRLAMEEATKRMEYNLQEAELRGILRLASRFRGKAKTPLSGIEMAKKVQQEADKLIRQMGLTPSQYQGSDLTTEGSSQDTVTPSRPGEHKKQELERLQ